MFGSPYAPYPRVWLIPRIGNFAGYNSTGALLYPLSELDRAIIISSVMIVNRRDAWGDVTDAQWALISRSLATTIQRVQF
jgi:hypothetical protein